MVLEDLEDKLWMRKFKIMENFHQILGIVITQYRGGIVLFLVVNVFQIYKSV